MLYVADFYFTPFRFGFWKADDSSILKDLKFQLLVWFYIEKELVTIW